MIPLFNRYDQTPGEENVAAREIKSRLDNGERVNLLDVREPWEYETAKIEGAKLIPLAELDQRKTELDPNTELIVYCHKGVRGLKAVRHLKNCGFTNTKNLSGGIEAWSDIDPSVPKY
ncbi:MAG: rhodanese-like domain-containing protein [Elusimicrobia bacterium]|nr:rhodanese-like domain-containing protein [Elusimicrobiota bacterium]